MRKNKCLLIAIDSFSKFSGTHMFGVSSVTFVAAAKFCFTIVAPEVSIQWKQCC